MNILKGNASKAKKKLKWLSKTNLENLIDIMIKDEIKFYQNL